jgi:spermidine/putrescine transport system permease protein
MVLACLAWTLGLIVLPELMMVDYSFRPNLLFAEIGGPKDVHTLANYETLWRNTIHLSIFFKTIWGSALVTVVTLVMCYPLAYFLGQVVHADRLSTYLLMLIVPFWINEILRTFAWFIILAYQGPLNALLLWLGLTAEPIRLHVRRRRRRARQAYAYLLFMVFALQRHQIARPQPIRGGATSAGPDLADPLARGGAACQARHRESAASWVFMLTAGSYAVPAILGGCRRWIHPDHLRLVLRGQNWNGFGLCLHPAAALASASSW